MDTAEESSTGETPRRSLIQSLSSRLPRFLSTTQPNSAARRSTDLGRFSSRTPDFIRRAMSLQPRRLSEYMSSDSSSNSKHRDSIMFSTPAESNIPSEIDDWKPTHRQRDLLKLTWSDDFDFLFDLGTNIYVYIFDQCPQVRHLFPAVLAYGDNWRENREFRAQALKFVQTLSQAIKNVHHIERLQPILYDIGRAHIRFAERGFRHEYWDLFEQAMEAAIAGHIATLNDLTDEDRHDAMQVWRILSQYIILQMRKGFLDAMSEKS